MTPDTLVTTYLALTSSAQFQAAYIQNEDFMIMASETPSVSFYRFLYKAVGEAWTWHMRLTWSDEQLYEHLAAPSTRLYVAYERGTPCGYIELDADSAEEGTEIAYFGLMPPFLGKGYGKHLLSYGIQAAFDDGASRVWVHTCNQDGPYALANYQKRGMKIYKTEEEPMPEIYT